MLRADVLYTQPPIVKRIMIVIQLSNKIAKIGKGILFNIPVIINPSLTKGINHQ